MNRMTNEKLMHRAAEVRSYVVNMAGKIGRAHV